MKIVTVLGARPQFIKASVVSRALAAAGLHESIVHTGQHYSENMSDIFFRELDIPPPTINLGIGSDTHGHQTGRMLMALEDVFRTEAPDWVLVYGDTNSTLAGALAAVKLHIPVAHVEAGLRSFNRKMPEEINRIMTDHASELHFAPTDTAVANLLNEGFDPARVENVGDVMYDAALHAVSMHGSSQTLAALEVQKGQYALATIHRAENTDNPARLAAIFTGLSRVAETLTVIVPLHPRTKEALARAGICDFHAGLKIVEPLGFFEMSALEASAKVVITDSGGLQKEAFFHGTPCVTLRDETEWTELVELGWNHLVPPKSAEAVVAGVNRALSCGPGRKAFPFGNGEAALAIARILASGRR